MLDSGSIRLSNTSHVKYTIYQHPDRVSVGMSISPMPSADLKEVQEFIKALQTIEEQMVLLTKC